MLVLAKYALKINNLCKFLHTSVFYFIVQAGLFFVIPLLMLHNKINPQTVYSSSHFYPNH